MIGLDYLMAGYLHLASDVRCSARKAPEITVAASDDAIRYDRTKTREQLDNFKYDTVSPYGSGVKTHVGGLTNGEVSLKQTMRFYQETFPSLNTGCLYIDNVKVRIDIKSTIYIDNRYKESGCMYHAILEHEKKHIAVDQDIIARYTKRITDGLKQKLAASGYSFGPFSIRDLPARQKKLENFMQDIVKQYSAEMSRERQEKQQAVDTLQEYRRVQGLCEGKD